MTRVIKYMQGSQSKQDDALDGVQGRRWHGIPPEKRGVPVGRSAVDVGGEEATMVTKSRGMSWLPSTYALPKQVDAWFRSFCISPALRVQDVVVPKTVTEHAEHATQ